MSWTSGRGYGGSQFIVCLMVAWKLVGRRWTRCWILGAKCALELVLWILADVRWWIEMLNLAHFHSSAKANWGKFPGASNISAKLSKLKPDGEKGDWWHLTWLTPARARARGEIGEIKAATDAESGRGQEFLEWADQLQEVDVLASSSPTWCTSLSTCSATTIADQLQKVDMFGVWAALPAPACISSRFIAIIYY